MRLKPIPEPPADLDGLAAARRAVPLVPGSEADCCARLQDRLELPARDEARTWLTFLRAMGLARETSQGFARTQLDVDGDLPPRKHLADSFRENVFAAREVLAALAAADEPLDPDAAFERVEDVVPQWERHKNHAWRETWRERVARLLGWAVLLGLAEETDGGFRAAEAEG